jgi:hypothetical protein
MYVRGMMSHRETIHALGGIRKVARALGHNSHTKVQGWAERDRIPVDHWPDIIALAGDLGKELTADDLLNAPAKADAA